MGRMEREKRRNENASTRPSDAASPADGTAASFAEFFEDEQRNLFAALVLITGNRHEAEELMQDSFVRVWEQWDRVSLMDSPSGYLYRTAMNGFRMRRRRARVAARNLLRRRAGDDPLEVVETKDTVDRALAGLSSRQRAALILCDLLDYTSEEAGELLGVKPSTVRSLTTQARAAVRKAESADD